MSNYINRLASNPNSIKGLKGKRDNELFPLYNAWLKLKETNQVVEDWYWRLRGTDEELIWACNNVPSEVA